MRCEAWRRGATRRVTARRLHQPQHRSRVHPLLPHKPVDPVAPKHALILRTTPADADEKPSVLQCLGEDALWDAHVPHQIGQRPGPRIDPREAAKHALTRAAHTVSVGHERLHAWVVCVYASVDVADAL